MNGDWVLPAILTSGGLVFISFIVIAVAFRHASKQLVSFHEGEDEPFREDPPPFWMERILTTRFKTYAFRAFTLSLVANATVYLVPILVAGPTPWWWTIRPMSTDYLVSSFILSTLVATMGFLVSRKVYYYLNEVLRDMIKMAKRAPQSKDIIQTLKVFILIAGGSSLYQGVCVLVTCVLFMVVHIVFVIPQLQEIACITTGLDMRPLLACWNGLLLWILVGGVIGPMATTISAFIIYCGRTFKDEVFFDVSASDRRGGFRSLGTLGMWSSFMASVTPGMAFPLILLAFPLGTMYEIATSMGLLFFLIICSALFFFVPIYYVHRAMEASRKPRIQKCEKIYRGKLDAFLERVEGRKTAKMTETLSMLALKEVYDDMTTMSRWPTDYLTVFKVIASVVLPILGYIIQLLTFG